MTSLLVLEVKAFLDFLDVIILWLVNNVGVEDDGTETEGYISNIGGVNYNRPA